MIIAVEGPSAVGKTTWCRAYCPDGFVGEAAENVDAPDLYASPTGVADFWVRFNIDRWLTAMRLERERGLAVCDGNPLGAAFSWAAWKAQHIPSTLFDRELSLYRQAIADRRIGFVDRVLWLDATLEELRRRARSDSTRGRKRHEVYLQMIPWLKAWVDAREGVLASTMRYGSDESLIRDWSDWPPLIQRYDPTILDRMMLALRA